MRRDDQGQAHFFVHRHPEDEHLSKELGQVAQWYVTRPVPESPPDLAQRLMTRLQAEASSATRVSPRDTQPIDQTLRMIRWQLTLLGPWFWITGSVLLILGVGTAPFLPQNAAITLLIYMLPLTTVLSAIYALRRVRPGLRDLEKSSPMGFVEMMAGVILALVCFNVVLGLFATIALSLVHWAAFGTLLASWLAPLLLLVASSFPVALRWGTGPAMMVGGVPWLLLILGAFARSGALSASFLLATQPGWLLALQLCAASLGIAVLAGLFLRGSTWQRALLPS